MWHQMRGAVIENFPPAPPKPAGVAAYLKQVRHVYITDAYHSLSIEGYRVTPALIARVSSGDWNPESDAQDRERRDAPAARGYWLASQALQKSLARVLRGENPGAVANEDHGTWYRELFAPGVTVGLIRAAVRAVLGHFLFVYIHPYPDGNGRIARFLMNVMLAGLQV